MPEDGILPKHVATVTICFRFYFLHDGGMIPIFKSNLKRGKTKCFLTFILSPSSCDG